MIILYGITAIISLLPTTTTTIIMIIALTVLTITVKSIIVAHVDTTFVIILT